MEIPKKKKTENDNNQVECFRRTREERKMN